MAGMIGVTTVRPLMDELKAQQHDQKLRFRLDHQLPRRPRRDVCYLGCVYYRRIGAQHLARAGHRSSVPYARVICTPHLGHFFW
jgi:hypothetical protein